MKATHRYVGPTTPYGLQRNAPCLLLGRARGAAGVVRIETADGRRWIVQRSRLEAAA